MSTVVTWQTESTTSEMTEQLAERLGKALRGGEVIELISDLGGGKTTFVRGLARGMGSNDRVASPTFTIARVYKAGELELYHFDFYRLHEPGLIAEELSEVLHDPKNVTVVEWADIVQDVLPGRKCSIAIEKTPIDGRRFIFRAPTSLGYLVKAVQE